jgi:hypothetical protein
MHLVKLSATHGLNLDHVVEWTDYPDVSRPWLEVILTPASQHETGAQEPYGVKLDGEERLAMLRWLECIAQRIG